MKKIVVFLILGLVFLFHSPKGISANVGAQCCSGSWYTSSGNGKCGIKGISIFDDNCNRSVNPPEVCDLSSQVCLVSGYEIPIDNVAPTCPIGYTDTTDKMTNWDFTQGRACCTTDFVTGSCKSGSLVNGQICPIRYKFDPGSSRCVLFNPTAWFAGNTTCQGVAGIDTAIGCVPTGDLKLFIAFVLRWVFFASGAVILLLIISTGYTIITSSGDPEKLQGAQENIVALFSGLALIAFSLVLLQAIGADILNLAAFKP